MTDEQRAALAQAKVVLVSACLVGEHCRYDGKDKLSNPVTKALEGKEVVPVCPEAGAGLGIPRPPAQLQRGDGKAVLHGNAAAVFKDSGRNVTEEFTSGAVLAVSAAKRYGATVAILKEQSPSCGSKRVWIDNQLTPGEGVTAAALKHAGVVVISDEDLEAP